MPRLFPLCVLFILSIGCEAQDQKTKPSPEFFAGGESDISSDDDDRASKAIRKWSTPGSKQGDKLLSDKPWFWDYSKVGRHVFLRVIKNSNRKGLLEVWLKNPDSGDFDLFKTYAVKYFSGDPGPKTETGDGQAPEGFYFISPGRMNSKSSYHLSMDMGYPNAYDRALERTGSLLMIHGSYVSIGCYAMTDNSIEQIYTLVHKAFSNGQSFVRVHCFPFPMTEENLAKHEESEHYEFWKNLKDGWDYFAEHHRPPNVEVEDKTYIFSAD